MSNAIDGTNFATSRPFAVAYTTASTSETAIARGGYVLMSDQNCVVKFGPTGLTAAAAFASTQPAAAATFSVQLLASVPIPIDIEADLYIRVIGNTASGTLWVQGPIAKSSNP